MLALASCPICGSNGFSDYHGRNRAVCDSCGSLERTRVTKLLLDHVVQPAQGAKVLHLRPEPALGEWLRRTVGEGYDAVEPRLRKAPEGTRGIDPWKDIGSIPEGSLDLVLHSHILQEIPGNYTLFLQLLHSRLKPGGYHLFAVPIGRGHYAENGDTKMSADDRKAQFGRERHLRRFGRDDFDTTLGAVFGITRSYSLLDHLLPETLVAAVVPEAQWKLSSTSVFCIRR